MKKLTLKTGRAECRIFVGSGITEGAFSGIEFDHDSPVAIVTDDTVDGLHGRRLEKVLTGIAGGPVRRIKFPAGEPSKTLETAKAVLNQCVDAGLDRKSTIIALGGGVVGDLAGFVASTYMRGIRLVQVPTTLIAQADSAIGGKTGVNLGGHKNMAGTFFQPSAVICDVSFLSTLPERQVSSGLAEVIKYSMICNRPAAIGLEANIAKARSLDLPALGEIVAQSVASKIHFVENDLHELGESRVMLNYGHSVGHAIEGATNYNKYFHGEAVALGMMAAGAISTRLAGFPKAEFELQKSLLSLAGLPTELPKDADRKRIAALAAKDKKNTGQKRRFVLLECIGKPIVSEKVTEAQVTEALESIS